MTKVFTAFAQYFVDSSVAPLKLYQGGWEASVHRQISDLSRDVWLYSSLGSGWATQGHLQNGLKATPLISWLCFVLLKDELSPHSKVKIKVGCHVPFTKEWLLSGCSTIQAWLVASWKDGCPSGRFSCLHRGTLELFGLPSLHGQPVLERLLLVPNFFQICASKQSCLRGLQTIPLTSCLGCTLTCTVNAGNL